MSRIRATIAKLLASNTTPPEIALGVALGVFVGVTPFMVFIR